MNELRTHLLRFHPHIKVFLSTPVLEDRHMREHYKYGSTTHHHGPNPGPHARPAGWRTGGDVTVLPERRAI